MENGSGSGGVALLERPVEANNESSDLAHYYCAECYPDPNFQFAFCGTDISGDNDETDDDDDIDCVVCKDLDQCPNDHPRSWFHIIFDEAWSFFNGH